ncbi:MAG: FecR domain-containing protein [Bacteroidales bacterium]|nr:FecR domain-containing protein [Bacteroidales bacterium]
MAKDTQKVRRFEIFLDSRKNQDVDAQIFEAEKIAHSIDAIDSQKAFRQVQIKIRGKQKRIQFLNILSRIAAILFVPLLIASSLFYFKQRAQSDGDQYATQRISNPSGIRSEIILPDGSKVWLNAESTISYKFPFGVKEREVKLTGEAFFDVIKDQQKPFKVESENVRVTVLGTRFNCKAFPEDSAIEVVLAEGEVKLNTTGSGTEGGFILKPGEVAVFDKSTYQVNISSEEIDKYIGWHQGKLILDECPLEEVARRLERWFGVEMKIVDQKISNYEISTTFENESIHQILTLLELASPVKATIITDKGTDLAKPANRKVKVILTSKN